MSEHLMDENEPEIITLTGDRILDGLVKRARVLSELKARRIELMDGRQTPEEALAKAIEEESRLIAARENAIATAGLPKDVFVDNLEQMMSLAGVSYADMAERFDIGIPIVDGMIDGSANPAPSLREDIFDFLAQRIEASEL